MGRCGPVLGNKTKKINFQKKGMAPPPPPHQKKTYI